MSLVRKLYRSWDKTDVRNACKLCLTTHTSWLNGRSLHTCVAEALVGGVSMVELRLKHIDEHEIAREARNIIPLCRVANVPFIVDDNIEVAKVSGADGVHLWELGISCDEVRKEFGRDAIVGISVNSVEEAKLAEEQGASYLSVGPMFVGRKSTPDSLISMNVLKDICDSVDIPVTAIGGISADNISDLAGTGVAGVTCVSAILGARDIEKAAERLSGEVEKYLLSDED